MNNKEQIIPKLSKNDKNQIKLSITFGYPPAETNKNGQIKLNQWKSWLNLQRLGCGYIKGDNDNYKFELTELGREISNEI